jgi:hypothetical protein
MKHLTPRFATGIRLIAAVSFAFLSLIWFAENAAASCGDYLLMGHGMSSHDQLSQRAKPSEKETHFGQWRWDFGFGPVQRPVAPKEPSNPCASGRCHSVPPIPWSHDFSRSFLSKESGFDREFVTDLARDYQLMWGRPSDRPLGDDPFLAIESPPPRRSA